jgi:hypothetical protein
VTEPFDSWPILSAALSGINDPPGRLRGREAFIHVMASHWGPKGRQEALAEMRNFLAGGDDEDRCRWLMGDLAPMYDPLVDFASYRDCVRWVRDQLAAGATDLSGPPAQG